MDDWIILEALMKSTEEMISRIGDSGLNEDSLIERINANIYILNECGVPHRLEEQ